MLPPDQNGLHPLFGHNSRQLPPQPPQTELLDPDCVDELDTSNELVALDGTTEKAPAKRKRKTIESTASQNAMRNFLGIPTPPQPAEAPPACSLGEKKPRGRPRKQVRLSLNEEEVKTEEEAQGSVPDVAKDVEESENAMLVERSEAVAPAPETGGAIAFAQAKDEPKQLLKLNGLGGFDSLAQPEQAENAATPAQESGRPKRSRKRKRAIVLRYGKTVLADRIRIGKQINSIMAQPQMYIPDLFDEPTLKPSPRKSRSKVDKESHPFFTGKMKRGRATTPPPKDSRTLKALPSPFKSFTTPGKMRSQIQAAHMASVASMPEKISIPSRIFSLPGTHHAAWPSKEYMHVRVAEECGPDLAGSAGLGTRKRKNKNEVLRVPLPTSQVRPTATQSLISPERLLLSGNSLQQSMASQVRPESLYHPMLARLHKALASTLTPFDVGAYESQLWPQKYAPRSAAEVFQSGQQASELKEWLGSKTTAHTMGNKPRTKEEERERKKKKRKLKQDGLDSFIVDSDDDAHTESSTPNAILLSGPSGCGKTAAVYAVAKELDFDVFEIGPNSRRSGKDILDKVGDMSLNHQVRRAERAASVANSVDGNSSEVDFTLPVEPDAAQSTLTAFFGGMKPKKPTTGSAEQKTTKKREEQLSQLKIVKEKASSQKQSLILIEEADILFEEDKQFWETIITLSTQSRRPIVLTCSDEDSIPQDELPLYTVLRFEHPSRKLITDYLLLVAAQEGHLLARQDVESLCKSRDLRRVILDLQFWCQMAVGDPKGGIDWYLQRWPKGVDKDDQGQTLRVLSKGTYHASLSSNNDELDEEEQLILNWRDGQLDPVESVFTLTGECLQRSGSIFDVDTRTNELREYSACFDHLSALDVSAQHDVPNTDSLDFTQPEVTPKTAFDYTTGHKLLRRATLAIDYEQFDTHLTAFTSMKLVQQLALLASRFSAPPSDLASHQPIPALTPHCPNPDPTTTREALNAALDPLTTSTTIGLADRDFLSTVLDTAPYIRSIASYDLALEQQRNSLSALSVPSASQQSSGSVSGGEGASEKNVKRVRTTRASRSALEGNARAVTRRERWFSALSEEGDLMKVIKTGF